MSVEYAKKKNDELAALCKERGLAHTGKKADLVKRLEDYDIAQGTSAESKPTVEDEIDWDEEPALETAKSATTQPAADTIAAGGIGEVANPIAVPNQIVVDPATNNVSADVDATAVPSENFPAVPAKDFSSGSAMRTLEEEIEKRKARARKFGMPEDTDEIKNLERAKRFGNTDLPGLLNQALPERSEFKKRGSEGLGAAEDGGIRKKVRGRPGQGRGKSERLGGNRREPASNNASRKENGSSWMTDKDREAAERRKARFAKA